MLWWHCACAIQPLSHQISAIFLKLELQQLVMLLVCPHIRMHRQPVLRR